MSIPPSSIRNIESDLIARGYAQRHWRRGAMGTRVYAKGNERVVVVRNTGVDRHPPEGEPATLEHWFVRLEALLDDLRKGAKLTELYLCGEDSIELPERFLRWCKALGIKLHDGAEPAPAQDADTSAE